MSGTAIRHVPTGDRCDLRSAGQRGAHRALLRSRGRGRADHRRRPHRRDGRARWHCKAGARFVVITDVNDYRLGAGRQDGRDRRGNVARQDLRDV